MNVALVQEVCRPVRVNPNESLSVCSGQWNEIDGAEKGTCLAFNRWGTLLCVGEKEGLIIIWDFSSIPNIIRELDPKSSSLPDVKQANACGWSYDGRILAVACELKAPGRKGILHLWDMETSILIAAIACDSLVNHVSFESKIANKNNQMHRYCLLLSCANGDLQTLVWGHGTTEHAIQPHHVSQPFSHLHFQLKDIETAPLFNSVLGDATQTTRNITVPVIAKYGLNYIYCVSAARGGIIMLDSETFKPVGGLSLPSISSVDLFIDETSLLVPSSKGIHEIAVSNSPPSLKETRMYTAGAAVRAPWIMASKSPDRKFILGIPLPRGLFVGEKGMFVWTDGDEGEKMYHDHRFTGEMVASAWHPTKEMLAVISNAGSVHLLEVPYTSSWPGAMYPPGFTLITDNVVYEEPEDEFDLNPKVVPAQERPNEYVDIMTIDEQDDEGCLKYIPASPLTTWNFEAPAFEDDDVSSIFSFMKKAPVPPQPTPLPPQPKAKRRKGVK